MKNTEIVTLTVTMTVTGTRTMTTRTEPDKKFENAGRNKEISLYTVIKTGTGTLI